MYCYTKELKEYNIKDYGYQKYIPNLNSIKVGGKYRILLTATRVGEFTMENDELMIITMPTYLFMTELQYKREEKLNKILNDISIHK